MDLQFSNWPQPMLVLVTLFVVFVYFIINRYITQMRSGRQLNHELAHNDNFAFGLSYAGSIIAFVLIAGEVFHGMVFEDPIADLIHAFIYALLAIAFIELGRYIHDHYIMANFDENLAINQKNTAGAVLDAASVISNGICIIAIYQWSGANTMDDLLIIILMFFITQAHLFAVARWREHQYAKVNQGDSMQRTLSYENMALSIHYAGYLISGAIAIKAAGIATHYQPHEVIANMLSFFLFSTVFTVATVLLAAIASKIVLAGINADVEIDHQDNVGIAIVEFATIFSIALILLKLFE